MRRPRIEARDRPSVDGWLGSTCASFWAWSCVFALASGVAASHVVMGSPSLHLRVVEAELIVRARVVDPDFTFALPGGSGRRQLIEIDVLESLKGRAPGPRLHFAQSGHGDARYEAGQEAIFFLEPIARSRELRALAVEGGPSHVSRQEHDPAYLLEPSGGSVLVSAIRHYVASESVPSGEAKRALIRRATLELLTSGDPPLVESALAALVLAPRAALVTEEDAPRLLRVIEDPALSIGLRAGLIRELGRRGLIDDEAQRVALLRGTPASERSGAIRALAASPGAGVKALLRGWLDDPETAAEVVMESAIALGGSRDPAVVTALADVLGRAEPRVCHAVIRGLGANDTEEARRVLEATSREHREASVRRRALAELRSAAKRDARSAARSAQP